MTEIPDLPEVLAPDITDDDLIILYDVGAATQKSRHATRANFLGGLVRTTGTFAVGTLNATGALNAPAGSIDDLTVSGSLILGGEVTKMLSGSAAVAIPTVASGAEGTVTMSLTGAIVGDIVTVNGPSTLPAGLILRGVVTAPDEVTIYAVNASAASITGASHTLNVMLVRFA